MATFKNIRIKKRGGGTRLQRVKVLASGKYKFVKNVKSSKTKTKTKKSKTKRKSRVAKKKNRSYKRVPRIPMALVGGGLGALTVTCPSGSSLMQNIAEGDIQTFGYNAREIFTGIDANGNFNKDFLKKGWMPIIIGAALHIVATKLGINRALYNAQKGFPIKMGL